MLKICCQIFKNVFKICCKSNVHKKKSNTFFTSTYLTKNCIICMKELWSCSPISHIGVANY